jgi:hypothetical protein
VSSTVAQLIDRALEALAILDATAAPVDDELQYVTDLGTVWSTRLRAVAAARGAEVASAETQAAIEVLVAEAALVSDPHRAIDWLSTLPQVTLAAMGEAT